VETLGATADRGTIPFTVQADDARAVERAQIAKARSGDLSAFEALYRANASRIYGLCLRLCGDPSLAEDLTQEAFVRAWQKLDSFRGESAFSSWLYPLAGNVALTERRSRRRRDLRLVVTDDLAPFEKPDPAARSQGPESQLDLERALSSLPPGARSVFVLHDAYGFKHQEIAEMTGVAAGTSKAQLHRARRLLREVLKP